MGFKEEYPIVQLGLLFSVLIWQEEIADIRFLEKVQREKH